MLKISLYAEALRLAITLQNPDVNTLELKISSPNQYVYSYSCIDGREFPTFCVINCSFSLQHCSSWPTVLLVLDHVKHEDCGPNVVCESLICIKSLSDVPLLTCSDHLGLLRRHPEAKRGEKTPHLCTPKWGSDRNGKANFWEGGLA